MKFPRYPKYKDSGVEWLGEVPEHWEVAPLKRSLRLVSDRATTRQNPVALENIEGWSGRFIETESKYEADGVAFSAGDILFGKLRPYLAKVYLAESAGEAVGDFHVLRLGERVISRFAQYQILQRQFIDVVDGSTFGSKMPRASWEALGAMPFVVPSEGEQGAIAAFLDRETAKIDALIAEQEKLIALLKEKRQALISHAVTKGLDPDAPMKDSGIEWLGDVPAHWDTTTIRRVALRVDTGGTPIEVAPSDQIEDPTPWFTPGDFTGPLNLAGSARAIPRSIVKDGEAKCFPAGSTLIVSIGATLGKVGYAASECSANQQINAIIPTNRLDGYFLTYSLTIQTDQMRFLSNASTIGIINQEKTKGIMIAVPPREEQAEICRFLDDELKRHESLECAIARAIALLKERRAALISAAVTGKIDVRAQALQNEQLSP